MKSRMQVTRAVLSSVLMMLFCVNLASAARPRIIATTDGEIDDRCSMVRFLLYANEWDIEGIIISSSKFHWDGHKWAGVEWIDDQIDEYAKIYDTLKQHAEGFPTPEQLKSKVRIGNISNVGAMDKDTPGSDRIVEVLLDDKPGPVYLQAWGGTNTIARALWKIQHEHPEQMKKVTDKAIIYIILDQDTTFRKYIEPNWPGIQVLGSFSQFRCIAYRWERNIPRPQKTFFEKPWMEANILKDHGPLCSLYEAKNGAFRSEGDSPAFMHQIRVGLRSLEDPTYGGWGGRFIREKSKGNTWRGAKDSGDLNKPIWRWAEAFQNDWAARADWCVKDYDQANHPPIARLDGPLDLKVAPGKTVRLNAAESSDPDGDELRFNWWLYREVGTHTGTANLNYDTRGEATVTFGRSARVGQTVHIICEVTDDGSPALTRYQRVIVEFANE
ncbi:MAG: nucleoside hydrolase-like domain-containing protein [Planctomycetota bacterium]